MVGRQRLLRFDQRLDPPQKRADNLLGLFRLEGFCVGERIISDVNWPAQPNLAAAVLLCVGIDHSHVAGLGGRGHDAVWRVVLWCMVAAAQGRLCLAPCCAGLGAQQQPRPVEAPLAVHSRAAKMCCLLGR